MGSMRAAFQAGKTPKNSPMPTDTQKASMNGPGGRVRRYVQGLAQAPGSEDGKDDAQRPPEKLITTAS